MAVALAGALPRSVLAVHWQAIIETPTAAPAPEGPPRCRWGGPLDIPSLGPLGCSRGDLAARLRRGDRFILALEGESPIGWLWFRAGSWREGDVEYRLPESWRWAYDSFVLPGHRGRGIHPALARRAGADLAREGVRAYASAIDHVNASSLGSARSRGGRPAGSVVAIGVMGIGLLRESWDGLPGATWRLYRRSHPTTVALPAHGGES